MKYIAILIIFAFFAGTKPCATKGDSTKVKLQALDTLKNRNRISTTIENISLSDVLKSGDDEQRFNSNQYVTLQGFVFDVKHGQAETCNCHTTDATQKDIHIEIVQDLSNSGGTKRMVVEVNRYTIAQYPDMNYENIHKLIGKNIRFSGWLFFDEEHKQNAFNTSPTGTDLWRATCWEVHPCMNIKVIN